MGRIVLIAGEFDIYERGVSTGRKEFVVSHGIDEDSGRTVVLPTEHPRSLGGRFDRTLGEWVLDD